jgi:OFA family oxalate/formate antiporter-like MFS transporter
VSAVTVESAKNADANMTNHESRWISMTAALAICLFTGFGYSWSVVQTPIATVFAWKTASVSLTFTMTVCFSTLSPLLFGKWIQKLSMRRTVIAGAVIYGFGLFATGFMGSIWHLYLFYGVFSGIGSGIIYPSMMSYVVRLFPERPGLVSGFGTAFYGAGAIVWAPAMAALLAVTSIRTAFNVLGACFCAVIVIAALFLREPSAMDSARRNCEQSMTEPQHTKPSTEQTGECSFPAAEKGKPYFSGDAWQEDLRRGQMVRTSRFRTAVAAFSLGLTAGLMVISQASPILQQSMGFDAARAAMFVSVFAACNMLGRFAWGAVSDSIGLFSSMALLFCIAFVSMALLAVIKVPAAMLACMGFAASCYGGLAGILTPITAKMFGQTYITENYGVMYIVFGISSLLAPNLAIQFVGATGAYEGAYITAAVFALAGLVLTRVLAFGQKTGTVGNI